MLGDLLHSRAESGLITGHEPALLAFFQRFAHHHRHQDAVWSDGVIAHLDAKPLDELIPALQFDALIDCWSCKSSHAIESGSQRARRGSGEAFRKVAINP